MRIIGEVGTEEILRIRPRGRMKAEAQMRWRENPIRCSGGYLPQVEHLLEQQRRRGAAGPGQSPQGRNTERQAAAEGWRHAPLDRDWAACCFAASCGLLVVIDASMRVY